MLTLVLTFSSMSAFASTGAEKFMAKLEENFRLKLEGKDCEVLLHYNEVTSISSGGPIRIDGSMQLNTYEINPHIDISKAIVSDNKIEISWSNVFKSSNILLELSPSGEPLLATGTARNGIIFDKKECKILNVYRD